MGRDAGDRKAFGLNYYLRALTTSMKGEGACPWDPCSEAYYTTPPS